ncbi:MAG TPA: zf-HC2 domain-containing protein [Verrucomicrobiae bacterium]
MTCSEVRQLSGPYLDSELDAKTTAEIQQHLLACAECTYAFATEAKLEAQITADLNAGRRTAALWEPIEAQLVRAAPPAAPVDCTSRGVQPAGWWRELLWPCPQAWAVLAAVWVVVWAVNFATPEPKPMLETRRVTPPSPQMRQILKEQKRMLAELGGVAEQLDTERPGRITPQPRSQRHGALSNT